MTPQPIGIQGVLISNVHFPRNPARVMENGLYITLKICYVVVIYDVRIYGGNIEGSNEHRNDR